MKKYYDEYIKDVKKEIKKYDGNELSFVSFVDDNIIEKDDLTIELYEKYIECKKKHDECLRNLKILKNKYECKLENISNKIEDLTEEELIYKLNELKKEGHENTYYYEKLNNTLINNYYPIHKCLNCGKRVSKNEFKETSYNDDGTIQCERHYFELW